MVEQQTVNLPVVGSSPTLVSMEIVVRECPHHGETEYTLQANGIYRCKKCRSYQVTKNRKMRKQRLVEEFGGVCARCRYDRCQAVLQFHHIDPQTKEFGISASGLCRSWEKMLAEAKKCVLLCSNCHIELENGIWLLDELKGHT